MNKAIVSIAGLLTGVLISLSAQGCCGELNTLPKLVLHSGAFEWLAETSYPRDTNANHAELVFAGPEQPVELHYTDESDGREYTVHLEITEVFTGRAH